MLRELSVRDVVAHSANTRLAADVPSAARAEHVDATLRYMHLSHVASTNIGDEETRGISGGERKRVNVAIELVSNPAVLVADELTTVR